MTWTDFYRTRVACPRYSAHFRQKYGPFLAEIHRRVKQEDWLLEVGCGIASTTRTLEGWYGGRAWYDATDIDADILLLAKQNASTNTRIIFDLQDARKMPQYRGYDIVHSHGLLEHMTDQDIRQVIAANQKCGARAAIHYVPSDKYDAPSFGDERLLAPVDWFAIAEPHQIVPFNGGYDLALIWEFKK